MLLDNLKAKELFIKYSYSTFNMGRESLEEFKKYQNYNISTEQELLWIYEYQKDLLRKLSICVENTDFANLFYQFWNTKVNYPTEINLKELLNVLEKSKMFFDSVTKMYVAEGCLRIVGSFNNSVSYNKRLLFELEMLAIKLLHWILINPISVDYKYLYLGESVEEKEIIGRVQSVLEEWEKK